VRPRQGAYNSSRRKIYYTRLSLLRGKLSGHGAFEAGLERFGNGVSSESFRYTSFCVLLIVAVRPKLPEYDKAAIKTLVGLNEGG